MKWIQISQQVFEDNRAHAKFQDSDDCFGIEIEKKLYLYYYNGCDYFLDIYEKSLAEIVTDFQFLLDLSFWYASNENRKMFDKIMKGMILEITDLQKLPFYLEDIHLCGYGTNKE